MGKINKFKIEDITVNKVNYTKSKFNSTNRFVDKKLQALSQTQAMSGNSSANNRKNQNIRIFDSVLFSGFQGMEVDNMAMMIKTFNR